VIEMVERSVEERLDDLEKRVARLERRPPSIPEAMAAGIGAGVGGGLGAMAWPRSTPMPDRRLDGVIDRLEKLAERLEK